MSRYYAILQRGYLVSEDIADFKEQLFSVYEGSLSRLKPQVRTSASRKIFDQLTSKYTSSYGEDMQIDLWARTGRKFFLYGGGTRCVTDYAALVDILEDILRPIGGMDGVIGNIRGDVFPEYVKDHIAERIGDTGLWAFRRNLLFKDDKRGEVDVGIQYRDTLFIIECANMSKNIDDDMGRPQAVRDRMSDLDKRIDKLDRLSSRLAGEQTGKNWTLPPGIRWIVPLVTTPYVEYLTSLNAKYWLRNDMPRVCTPDELVSFIEYFESVEHAGKPWMLLVKGA